MSEVLGTFSFLSHGSLAFSLGWYFSWIRVYFLIHPCRSTCFSHRDGFSLPLGLSCLGSHKPSLSLAALFHRICNTDPNSWYIKGFTTFGFPRRTSYIVHSPILSFISTWSAFFMFILCTPILTSPDVSNL